MASATVRSATVVLMVLSHCLLLFPLFMAVLCLVLVLIVVLASCPIQLRNHLAKDERVDCFTLVVFLHCVVGWFAVCKRGITW